MHRTSESVAAIATALAKAQTELSNPEKSKVGKIVHTNRSDSPQTFRYAPLSSGLEIVRKILGGQQIAVAQTTAIDNTNRTINLTTTLMHTSGEWISSDWPVCQLSETAAPRRMGAALTYARRYALFTLVGIAGEEDLDAPNIQDDGKPTASNNATQIMPSRKNGSPTVHNQTTTAYYIPPIPQESASARDQLTTRINSLASISDLRAHASGILKSKNLMLQVDAKIVEDAFAAKMIALEQDGQASGETEPAPLIGAEAHGKEQGSATVDRPVRLTRKKKNAIKAYKRNGNNATSPSSKGTTANGTPPVSSPLTKRDINITTKIDKSKLTIDEPRRLRSKEHLRFVSNQPCLVCGRTPSDAHHLRFAQPRAMARKTSDEFTVPLCRVHHRENHRTGVEQKWWLEKGLNPLTAANELWVKTRSGGEFI